MLWSDESTFQIVFGNRRSRALWAKEEKHHPDYRLKFQKAASVMVWECAHANGHRQLTHL